MKEIIKQINECADYEALTNLKNIINKRLVELADDGLTLTQKIYNLLPLATEYDSSIPTSNNKNDPCELLTDFMDEYMYVRREKTFDYDDIVEVLTDTFNNDGIELKNGSIMTCEQYNSILEFIYSQVKNGKSGFTWDW